MKYFFRRVELFVVDKFIPFWVNLLNTIRKITMLATFFCMIAGLVCVVYYQFFCEVYLPVKIVVSCIFVLTMIHLNLKLQD